MPITKGDGSIILETVIDQTGLNKGMKSLKGGFSALKKAVAAVGVTAFVKDVVSGYGEFEQLIGGAKKIFNEMDFSQIEKDANEAFRTMGLSASEYYNVMNNVGANFASTLGDKTGYETAKKGLQAITDYATGTGRNIEELSQKFQMITRSASSYQSIADQFAGILPATSAQFLEQAQATGLLSDRYKQLTQVPIAEYQRAVTDMLERGVQGLGLAGNAAAEATTTLSGSIAMMKSAWSNLKVGLGSDTADIKNLVENMTFSITAVMNNLVPILERIFDQLPEVVKAVVPQMARIVVAATPELVEAFSQLVAGVIQALPSIISGIGSALAEQLTSSMRAAIGIAGTNTGNALADGITNALSAITALMGSFALAIGAIICVFTGPNPIGLGLLVAGAAFLVTSLMFNEGDIVHRVTQTLTILTNVISMFSLAIGAILCCTGHIGMGVALIIAGIAGFGISKNASEQLSSYELQQKMQQELDAVNDVAEAGVSRINSTLSQINFSSSAFGGYSGSSNSYGYSSYSIPKLARGAVIPPNREFLAVLGDQRSGTNIETPLDTMIQAFNAALNGRSANNDNIPIVIEVDGRVFGETSIKQIDKEKRRVKSKVVVN